MIAVNDIPPGPHRDEPDVLQAPGSDRRDRWVGPGEVQREREREIETERQRESMADAGAHQEEAYMRVGSVAMNL